MAAESRVGGLLGGKPGVTVFHMGDSKRRYSLSMTFWKTAMCRSASCCRPTLTATFRCLSRRWSSRAKAAPSISPAALTNRSPLPKVLPARSGGYSAGTRHLSSDGNGSQPFFDDEGNLTHIGVAGFETLLETVQVLVKDYDFSISDALRPLTSSVAGFLNLTGKGEILRQ